MSISSLQPLKDKRDALLLAEVAALLHDVGKLSSQFIDQMSANPSANSSNFKHESAPEQLNGFVDNAFLAAFKNIKLRDSLKWDIIPRNKQIGQLLDLILHHDSRNHSAFLVQLLNRCDGADSGADKGTTRKEGLPKEAKQEYTNTFIASAFGNETQKLNPLELDDIRSKLTKYVGQELTNITSKSSEVLQRIKSDYEYGLGETRRPANDVTLWCHSLSVATLYKTSLATQLANRELLDIDRLRWRILRINFDVLGLYAKAIKIADLLGYQRAVEQVCERVKHLVEEEYPLGNEVYRDTTGIYFTFPDIDLPADLAQEIRRIVEGEEEGVDPEIAPRIALTRGDGSTAVEQLKGILAKARCEALQAMAQPFDSENLSTSWQHRWDTVDEGRGEVCPVCRLSPMKEGEEACERCLKRRGSRIDEWQKNPHRTIWMDEIADHNDRVALIVGKFGLDDWLSGDLVQTMLVKAVKNNPAGCTPKNPSPARLRRIWETCQRFWSETVEKEILGKHEYGKDAERSDLRCNRWLVVPDSKDGWRERVPYDGSVNGKPISILWREEGKHFITIINLQLTEEVEAGQRVTVSDPMEPRKKIIFTVQKVEKPSDRMYRYMPFLPLLSSPDQFLALVPAADALELANKIREEYAKQFGKVQNRLPLLLGLVFFHRKMPLFAVMETARRMLEAPMKEESWRVECCRPDGDAYEHKHQYLRLSQGEHRVIMQFPIKMGDNTTPDIWYPYVFVEQFADGTPDNRQYRFQQNGRWLVHVSDLKEGDLVEIIPSRLAYIWLEHTAKRFEFDPERHLMLMDELPRMMEMWGRLKESGITITSLRSLQALLEAKGAAWGMNSEEFEHLAEAALKDAGLFQHRDRDGNIQDVIVPDDVVSKRFARCLELYLHILKQKLKGGRNET
ncbi:MAG: CRISPR-associated protein Csx11 [Anaerolineae bacterium]|nr:CRISPR-associated protein Csx11 [Anaerolineae bacterium]